MSAGRRLRILAVSDQVVEALYSLQAREWLSPIHLILSCGDLPYGYLEFLMELFSAPLFYVHGNHDRPELLSDGRVRHGPEGGQNLDGRVVWEQGLLLGGLEGSRRYHPEGRYQYTEEEMWLRVFRLVPRLLWNQYRYGRAIDLLIAHAPPRSIGDGPDPAHQGFSAFRWLIDRFRPRYFLHGHLHFYGRRPMIPAGPTRVINVFPYYVLEIEVSDVGHHERKRAGDRRGCRSVSMGSLPGDATESHRPADRAPEQIAGVR
ncbi:metallophosphoesterase family protein [Thermoflexus sp.]|uniref:metallophosphoesterase family protein n=1 Tax=Thermoflexus sp. TaxID=1969742 RepID=UPI0025E4712D|nr:metallophosphoesterase [Thermoflexus sp.]MDW8180028.1 metallophosphoesterase [Anaerolineae bacterium]MCS6962867.1 metallophosphoesterase [Thermoflexus sp.]MCS7350577.1 metallophosphoesterase [Thermoflexus sp.]MCX7690706.1 metallophosphoesterase [Thermoflexus sp.]MDW8185131.1 metallophosphoesterase [Anaerolineae bacterium]